MFLGKAETEIATSKYLPKSGIEKPSTFKLEYENSEIVDETTGFSVPG